MAETKRLKVFLCHAHSDAEAVRELSKHLWREGADVWLDKEKLLPGADWDLEIRKAVRESDVVVVCLSKQFNQAGYRQKEVRLALDTAMEQPEGEIFIIPARLEECDTLESLRVWHWVDLFEEDGFQKLMVALRVRANSVGASLGESELEKYIKQRLQELENLTKPSQIRIDDSKNVWRGESKLGPLGSEAEYRVLKYLIARKGWVCIYTDLFFAIADAEVSMSVDTFNTLLSRSGWEQGARAIIREQIERIRALVEKNPQTPNFIIEIPGKGYKLDR
jgi:hypothetical protein